MVSGRFRVRDVGWIGGFVLFLGVGLVVVLLFVGGVLRLGRETISALLGLPGGAWAAGAVLGVVSVLGWAGARTELVSGTAGKGEEAGLSRGARAAGGALCWVAAFGPPLVLFSGLPGRNCRSSSCEYVPGTGTALVVYAVIAAGVGLGYRRWRQGVLQARRDEERARMRRLRKKGKGKSRAARQTGR